MERELTSQLLRLGHEGPVPPRVEHEVVHLLWCGGECRVQGDLGVMVAVLGAVALRRLVRQALGLGGAVVDGRVIRGSRVVGAVRRRRARHLHVGVRNAPDVHEHVERRVARYQRRKRVPLFGGVDANGVRDHERRHLLLNLLNVGERNDDLSVSRNHDSQRTSVTQPNRFEWKQMWFSET